MVRRVDYGVYILSTWLVSIGISTMGAGGSSNNFRALFLDVDFEEVGAGSITSVEDATLSPEETTEVSFGSFKSISF